MVTKTKNVTKAAAKPSHSGACTHHPGVPVFHDALKVWHFSRLPPKCQNIYVCVSSPLPSIRDGHVVRRGAQISLTSSTSQ